MTEGWPGYSREQPVCNRPDLDKIVVGRILIENAGKKEAANVS
jgi:hypothetical protein